MMIIMKMLMIQVSNCGACLHGARGALSQGSTCQGEDDSDDFDDDYEDDSDDYDDDYNNERYDI